MLNRHREMLRWCVFAATTALAVTFQGDNAGSHNLASQCVGGCQTSQSSTGPQGGEAWRALDGYPNVEVGEEWWDADASSESCMEAVPGEGSAWWRVDLGVASNIGLVKVWNRGGAQAARLAGFEIRVGNNGSDVGQNAICYSGSEVAMAPPFVEYARCTATGRFVYLVVEHGPLHVCEVEVFGAESVEGVAGSAWARYTASDWDEENRILQDSSASQPVRDSELAAGDIHRGWSVGHGARHAVDVIAGDLSAGIEFPANTIPPIFTVCSVTRWTECEIARGGQRILDAKTGNWLHGHWGGRRGVAFYEAWQHSGSHARLDDWLVMCGKNEDSVSALLVDGLAESGSSSVTGGWQLTINRGHFSGERSHWAFKEVIIWDRHLSMEEMARASDILHESLHNGDVHPAGHPPPVPMVDFRPCSCAGDVAQGASCWHFSETQLTHADAEAMCKLWSGHLASVPNLGAQVFMTSQVPDSTVWIGLKRLPASSAFAWLDGTESAFHLWDDGAPNNHGGAEDCGLAVGGRVWNDVPCDIPLAYACKKELPLDVRLGEEPCSFRDEEDRCYLAVHERSEVWQGAQERCREWGGALATVPNAEVNAQLSQHFSLDSWTGLTRPVGGSDGFVWSDGAMSAYRQWADGEPNGEQAGEDCGQRRANGEWSNSACDVRMEYTCSKTARNLAMQCGGACPATQSSTATGGEAWRALDSSPRVGDAGEGSCVLTEATDARAWWRVDLEVPRAVGMLKVWGRGPPPECVAPAVEHAGQCVTLQTTLRSYEDAKLHCEGNGQTFFTVDSQADLDFVVAIAGSGERVWTGATDLAEEGVWRRPDGSPAGFLSWMNGEPNNWGNAEHCAMIGWEASEQMNDAPCEWELQSLCSSSRTRAASIDQSLKLPSLEVRVGDDGSDVEQNSVCYSGPEAARQGIEYARCNATGRFVFLVVADGPLHVCEVEVMGPESLEVVAPGAWARYQASDWDSNLAVLRDSSGNQRDSVLSEGSVWLLHDTKGVPVLSGGRDAGITFPADSIPSVYTICSVTRFTACPLDEEEGVRVLDSVEGDWAHGHWRGLRGVAHYGGSHQVSPMVAGGADVMEWLVVCGKNDGSAVSTLFDGVPGVPETAQTSWGGRQLTINRGNNSGAGSHWAVAEVVVWDRHLDLAEMVAASDALHGMMRNGHVPTGAPFMGCDHEADGVCWAVMHEWMPWCEAETYCQAWGGHLATITSDADIIIAHSLSDRLPFIGLHRDALEQDEFGWRWASGSNTTYKKWGGDVSPWAHCAVVACNPAGCDFTPTLSSSSCSNMRPAICNTRDEAVLDTRFDAEEDGMQWKVFPAPLSWSAAEDTCLAWGGHLATIEHLTDNDVAFRFALEYFLPHLWLGLHSGTEGWEWASGASSRFRKWNDGVQAPDGPACAYTDEVERRHRWSIASCADAKPFLCNKVTGPRAVHPEVIPPVSCSDVGGQTVNGSGKCFYVQDTVHSWADAQTGCELSGGQLASVTSSEESELVHVLREAAGVTGSAGWLGGSDTLAEGVHLWVDGAAWEWTNWAGAEPGDDDKDCVRVQAAGEGWEEGQCGEALPSACAVQTECTWTQLGQSSIHSFWRLDDRPITPSRAHYGTYSRFKVQHDGGYLSINPSPEDTWWRPNELLFDSSAVPIELILDRSDDDVDVNSNDNLIAYGDGNFGDWVVSVELYDLDALGRCYFADADDDTVETTMHVPPESGGAISDVVCDGFPGLVALDQHTRIWADFPSSRLQFGHAQERTGTLTYTLFGCQVSAGLVCSPHEVVVGHRGLNPAHVGLALGCGCELVVDCVTQTLQRRGECEAACLSGTALELDDEHITSLAGDAFAGLGAATRIDLSLNALSTLEGNPFEHLTALTHLELRASQIQTVHPLFLAGLVQLVALDLSDNLLASLPPLLFAGLASLEHLHLANNLLTALPPHAFAGCAKLITLDLSGNLIAAVDAAAFAGMTRLETLYLDHNVLSAVVPSVWDGLSALHTLRLDNNHIASLPAGAFAPVGGSLASLDLSNNELTSLDAGTWAGLEALKELNVCCNEIASLAAFAFVGLASVETLDLSENLIDALLPNTFANATTALHLKLDDNQLTTLESGSFDGLSSLQTLTMRRCGVTTIQEGAFRGLGELQDLGFWHCPLDTVETGAFDGLRSLDRLTMVGHFGTPRVFHEGLFRGLASVRELDFYLGAMHTLEAGAFRGAETAEAVSFHDGGLEFIHAGAFRGMGRLTSLDLNGNHIEYLEPGVFDGLGGLQWLFFTWNPLKCAPYLPAHVADFVLAWDPSFADVAAKGACLPLGCPLVRQYDFVPAFQHQLADGIDLALVLLEATELVMGAMRPAAARALDEANQRLGVYVARGDERVWCMGILQSFPAPRWHPHSGQTPVQGEGASPRTVSASEETLERREVPPLDTETDTGAENPAEAAGAAVWPLVGGVVVGAVLLLGVVWAVATRGRAPPPRGSQRASQPTEKGSQLGCVELSAVQAKIGFLAGTGRQAEEQQFDRLSSASSISA